MLKIDKIKQLCLELPIKDSNLAIKLINHRDFDSLEMLIDSIITRKEKAIATENLSSLYYNLNSESLMTLSLEITEYKEQLIENND